MAEYLDVTGDEIWMGSTLVGRILMPVGTQRDRAEGLLLAALDCEDLEKEQAKEIEALEKEHEAALTREIEWREEFAAERDAAEAEADELRAMVASLEGGAHAGRLLKLHDALKVALADNDKWRNACKDTMASKPKTRKRK